MTADELIRRIGAEGDALFRPTFSRKDKAGNTVPFTPPTIDVDALFTTQLIDRIKEAKKPGQQIGLGSLMLLAPLADLARLTVQGVYYPFSWLIWRLERMRSRWKRRSFFCPLCTNPMEDPLVCCPHCGRIQPRIQPTLTAPLLWRCDCGRGKWSTLGQYVGKGPKPLVCRDQPHVTGCHHRHPLGSLAGRHSSSHIALAGASLRAKHAVMAHLFEHMADGFGRKRIEAAPAWKLSDLELQLARKHLCRSFTTDTRSAEAPGDEYTLALSFLMLAGRQKHVYAVHNIAQSWLEKTDALNRKSLNWHLIRDLVVVLDPELLGRIDAARPLPQAEMLSRMIRVIEQYCDLRPGSELPHRLAVVLPVPRLKRFTDLQKDLGGLDRAGAIEGEVQRAIRERDPAVHALISRCFHPARVRLFCGPLPDDLDLRETEWLASVLDWLF